MTGISPSSLMSNCSGPSLSWYTNLARNTPLYVVLRSRLLSLAPPIPKWRSYLRRIQTSIQTCPFPTRQGWSRELYALHPECQSISPSTILAPLVIKHRLLSYILDRNFKKIVCGDGVEGVDVWLHGFLQCRVFRFRRGRMLK